MSDLTRRDFIKLSSMAALAMTVPINVFAADNCTVKTRYGTFNGFVDENGVKTWLGIPYAQPPVGKLRWQAPQPLKPPIRLSTQKKSVLRLCKWLTKTKARLSIRKAKTA